MKKYRSKNEILKILNQLNNSNISINQFCKANNLATSTVCTWKKRYLNIVSEKFGEININQKSTNKSKENEIKNSELTMVTDKIKINLQEGYNNNILERYEKWKKHTKNYLWKIKN